MNKEVIEPRRRTVPKIELEEIFGIIKGLGMIVHVIEGDLDEGVMVEIEVTKGLTEEEWNNFLQAKIEDGSGWCG